MRKLFCLLLALTLLICPMAFAWSESNADQYENAIGLLKENKYSEAGKAFAELGSYSDAPRYTMYCNAIAAGESGLYSIAAENFKSLDGFLDSSILAVYYAGLSWEADENYEKALELFARISLYRDVAARIAGYPALINARDYRKADENEQAGLIDEAYSGFTALGDYEDSADRAASLKERIDKRDADAAEKANADAYAKADQAEKDGRYEEAYDGFMALGNYSDSKQRAEGVQQRAQYSRGMEMISIGSYKEAYAIFKALGEFEDCPQKVYALGLVDFSDMNLLDASTASFRFHDKYGIINFADNKVTIPQWDGLTFVAENCLKFKSGELYGLVNCDGTELSSAKWYDLSKAVDGVMIAAIREKAEKTSNYAYTYFLVDTNGSTLTPAYRSIGDNEPETTSGITLAAPAFESGLIRVQTNDKKWGFVDKTGEVKIPVTFAGANDFSNGLAAVKDSRWGYIDAAGEYMITPQFSAALDFNENDRAEVRSKTSWHVIDKTGSIVYFDGQPFDEMPAEGDAGDEERQAVIHALEEKYGVTPEDEDFVWYLYEFAYGLEGVDIPALDEAAYDNNIDAAFDAFPDLNALLNLIYK